MKETTKNKLKNYLEDEIKSLLENEEMEEDEEPRN